VLAFHKHFSKGFATQLATPLNTSNDAKLDHSNALDDRYANKFAPLNSMTIYPEPGHVLLYTTFDW
jgi:hypothetical protein